jgi:hypothetical protein
MRPTTSSIVTLAGGLQALGDGQRLLPAVRGCVLVHAPDVREERLARGELRQRGVMETGRAARRDDPHQPARRVRWFSRVR